MDLPSPSLLVGANAGTTTTDNLWSGGKLMVWSPTKTGDTLEFTLPAREAGRYSLHLTAARTPQSGIIAAELDDQPLRFNVDDGNIDLRTEYRRLSRTSTTPHLDLQAGDHRLALRWLSPDSSPAPGSDARTVGIDFIWIQRR